MENNLQSLNNYLFEDLEKLSDDGIMSDEDSFKKEINRAKAISNIGNTIVGNAKIVLEAKKHADEMDEEDAMKYLQIGNGK